MSREEIVTELFEVYADLDGWGTDTEDPHLLGIAMRLLAVTCVLDGMKVPVLSNQN